MVRERAEDSLGRKYGNLTVVSLCTEGKTEALCLCDCGNSKTILLNSLRSGNTKTCGCRMGKTRKKHGHGSPGKRSPTYVSWYNMKQRCNNPKSPEWSRYGGKGISYDERWEDFETFLADMGERPDGTSLDRINPDGCYSKDNCRWATATVQSRNTGVEKRNKSGVTGVCKDVARNKWCAYITVDYKSIALGKFDTIEEAANARRVAEVDYWGDNR